MLCFLGTSFAANHLREAARERGFLITGDPEEAHIIFVSEDAGISEDGTRDLTKVREYIEVASLYKPILVLTSQVPPGFTRSLNLDIYHQPETLRIKDAEERALNPDYIVVGSADPYQVLPKSYCQYLTAFNCPVFTVTWEEAEFSKIAVNMTLASQVVSANLLSNAATKIGAKWDNVSMILKHDKRIGKHSYLEPGNWRDSRHLLRDYVTLKEINGSVPY